MGDLRESVRRMLEDEGMTVSELADALGHDKQKISDVLYRMAQVGEIHAVGFGLRDGIRGRIPFMYKLRRE